MRHYDTLSDQYELIYLIDCKCDDRYVRAGLAYISRGLSQKTMTLSDGNHKYEVILDSAIKKLEEDTLKLPALFRIIHSQ